MKKLTEGFTSIFPCGLCRNGIGPTDEEAHIGQTLLYWFFSPVGAALKATQIGQAMMEVTARGDEFANGDKLSTLRII